MDRPDREAQGIAATKADLDVGRGRRSEGIGDGQSPLAAEGCWYHDRQGGQPDVAQYNSGNRRWVILYRSMQMDEITYYAVQAILHGALGAVMIWIAILLSPSD
jgi:hypothetical protein